MRNTERTGNDKMASIMLRCSHRGEYPEIFIQDRQKLLCILSIVAVMKNSSPTGRACALYMNSLGVKARHVSLKHRIAYCQHMPKKILYGCRMKKSRSSDTRYVTSDASAACRPPCLIGHGLLDEPSMGKVKRSM